MAPSSPTYAATLKPSHLNVIIDGIRKKDGGDIRARLSARLSAHSVDDETWATGLSASSSPDASNIEAWAPATEMDEGSVERPEDLCICDDWDLEQAGWSTDCTAAEETAPANDIQLEDAAPTGENIWTVAGGCERTDYHHHFLDDNFASSDVEDDAAGVWWCP
ncbi:hypothetical protein T484DRAFT_1910571 [Baffinella frigidus]|nr:hypothetical protein T484DRAFT_1910571 [Cryptophyta sp. CCMP2293]